MTAYESILLRRWDDAYSQLHQATTPEGRQAVWEEMGKLSDQLTAERILRDHTNSRVRIDSASSAVSMAFHERPRDLSMKTARGSEPTGRLVAGQSHSERLHCATSSIGSQGGDPNTLARTQGRALLKDRAGCARRV